MTEPIAEIQAEIRDSTRQLQRVIGQLNLPQLLEALKQQYPRDTDVDAIKDDIVCPPLAWEMHNEVANAKILFEEAIASLQKASCQSEASVLQEWCRRRLDEINDPPTQALMMYLIRAVVV